MGRRSVKLAQLEHNAAPKQRTHHLLMKRMAATKRLNKSRPHWWLLGKPFSAESGINAVPSPSKESPVNSTAQIPQSIAAFDAGVPPLGFDPGLLTNLSLAWLSLHDQRRSTEDTSRRRSRVHSLACYTSGIA